MVAGNNKNHIIREEIYNNLKAQSIQIRVLVEKISFKLLNVAKVDLKAVSEQLLENVRALVLSHYKAGLSQVHGGKRLLYNASAIEFCLLDHSRW